MCPNQSEGRAHNLTERLESRGRAQNGNRATLRVLDCFLCKSSRRRAIILPCDTRQSALLTVQSNDIAKPAVAKSSRAPRIATGQSSLRRLHHHPRLRTSCSRQRVRGDFATRRGCRLRARLGAVPGPQARTHLPRSCWTSGVTRFRFVLSAVTESCCVHSLLELQSDLVASCHRVAAGGQAASANVRSGSASARCRA